MTKEHAPGTFCWWELSTTDQNAAKKFYGELFGWEHDDMPMGPDSIYTMLKRDGETVGALYQLGPQQAGAPAHWLPYVAVNSADDAIGKVGELGGTTLQDAFDVMDVGRMGLLKDPTGATLAVWEPRRHKGASLTGATGAAVWTELLTSDAEKSGDFHSQLFNWGKYAQNFGSSVYTSFMNGERPAGGMFPMPQEAGSAPSHWVTYFGVDDCAASTAKAEELGGTVMVKPTQVDGVGTFAVLRDPQGALFGILQPERGPANN